MSRPKYKLPDGSGLYYCAACKVAKPREEWGDPIPGMPAPTHICPNCGGYFKIDIVNEVEVVEYDPRPDIVKAAPKAPAKPKSKPKAKPKPAK